jgi:hypothetical protein
MAIVKKKPPASHIPIPSKPSEPILKLWDILNACWDIVPAKRPSARELEEFVMGERVEIVAALSSLEG